jgi:hypothetical protein
VDRQKRGGCDALFLAAAIGGRIDFAFDASQDVVPGIGIVASVLFAGCRRPQL